MWGGAGPRDSCDVTTIEVSHLVPVNPVNPLRETTMSVKTNSDVASRAANISGEFETIGVDMSPASVEEQMESMTAFKVPVDDAQVAVVRKLIDEFDLSDDDVSEDLAALAGYSSSGGRSEDFDRTLLSEIPDLGDEEWVDVRAQVIDLWDVTHDSMAQVGLVADESAQMKFVKWAKNTDELPTLEEGVTYDFSSVITNEYEGKFSISLNKASSVVEAEQEVIPADGSVSATGTLVAIEDGSGLIKRCPEENCSRLVTNGRCAEHGEVDGEFDLRIKAILDDGQSAVRALFNDEMTEAVTGMSLEEAIEMAMETVDPTVVLNAFRDQLIGRTFEVSGPVIGDYFLVDDVAQTVYSSEQPGLEDGALDPARTQRQPAKRVFAQDLNQATHSFTRPEDGEEDRAPNFSLLPSGEAANRVFVVGTLMETKDVGTDSEYWRGTVMAASESVSVYAGEYQPEAMQLLSSTETPCYVAVIGKIHSYETDYGINVSLQPEHISVVDEAVRDSWVAETLDATQDRLGALESGETEEADAVLAVYEGNTADVEAAVEDAVEELVAEMDVRETPAQ